MYQYVNVSSIICVYVDIAYLILPRSQLDKNIYSLQLKIFTVKKDPVLRQRT